jgi:hypothetical protein
MYSLYDGGADINELQNRLEKHIRMFFKTAFPLDKAADIFIYPFPA